MNGKQRLQAIVRGEEPDQVPAALWMHLPAVDRDPAAFTQGLIDFADAGNWDLIKVQVNAAYFLEAYGAGMKIYENPPLKLQRTKKLYDVLDYPVKTIEDLRQLQPVTIEQAPNIQNDLQVTRALIAHYQNTKTIIATLFSDFYWLCEMTEGHIDKVREFIREDKDAVFHALQVLDQTNRNIVDGYVEAGVDGFFMCTKCTSPLVVTEEEFAEFNKAFDVPFLTYMGEKTWFNMLHVHGNADLYIEQFAQYPVQSINWENISHSYSSIRMTSAAQLRHLTDKILVGGTDQFYDFYGSREVVEARLRERVQQFLLDVGDTRVLIGAGCSLPLDVPMANLPLLRKVVDELAQNQ